MQPGGASEQLLGVDAVREFNVLRDTYGAEYGKRPGGQVIIVTQSGTNQLHGSAYDFLRNNDARRSQLLRPGHPRRRSSATNSAARWAARSRKIRPSVFANYEGFRQNLHQTSAAFVPDATSRAAAVASVQPLLNLWPTPPPALPTSTALPRSSAVRCRPFAKTLEQRASTTFSRRGTRFRAIYTVDDGSDLTATPLDPYSSDILNLREQVASLEETHVFSPTLLNTARFGYSRAGYFFTGEPTPGTPAATVPGFLLGGPWARWWWAAAPHRTPRRRSDLAGSNNGSNLTVARNLFTYEGPRDADAGTPPVHLRRVVPAVPVERNPGAQPVRAGDVCQPATFLHGTTSHFLYDPAPTEMNWRSLFGALYAEDVIRLTPNFTVSSGLPR